MKKPKDKLGCAIYVIGFILIVSVIRGIFVGPFDNSKTKELLINSLPTATPEPVAARSFTEEPEPTAEPAPMVFNTMVPTNTPEPTEAPTSVPTNTPEPEPTEPPTLRQGDKGDAVKVIQQRLIDLGYLSGNADGDFGKKTTQAVKDFQVCNGLKEDGIWGKACWDKIDGYFYVSQMTVYVSKKGVYHTKPNCSGMKNSTKMSLSDAIRKGHKAHSNGCH